MRSTEQNPTWILGLTRTQWIASLVCWVLVGLIAGLRFHLSHWAAGRELSLVPVLARSVAVWLPWLLYTPLILGASRRWSLLATPPISRFRLIGVHLLLSSLISPIQSAFVVWFAWFPFWPQDPRSLLAQVLDWGLWRIHTEYLVYAGLVAGFSVFQLLEQKKREALTQAHQRRQKVTARLAALEAQLQPHFFFNSLHTIGALIRTGRNSDAVDTIARLGGMLRALLAPGGGRETTIDQELQFTRDYLAIEQIRFQDRLRVHIKIEDGLGAALLPHLSIQPLAENAIRHGISTRQGAGDLMITAKSESGNLIIEVTDRGEFEGEGALPASTSPEGAGISLSNMRERIETLYGPQSTTPEGETVAPSLELSKGQNGSTVRLVLPLRFETPDSKEARHDQQ